MNSYIVVTKNTSKLFWCLVQLHFNPLIRSYYEQINGVFVQNITWIQFKTLSNKIYRAFAWPHIKV